MNIPDVVDDAFITPEWGNQIRDRVVHTFANVTDRTAALGTNPPADTVAITAGIAEQYSGSNWKRLGTQGPEGHVPVITAFSGSVNLNALGDGTATARYFRHGGLLSMWAYIKIGTAFPTVGTGAWYCSLPHPISMNAAAMTIGQGTAFDASAGAAGTFIVAAGSADPNKCFFHLGMPSRNYLGAGDNGNPNAVTGWGPGDEIHFSVTYPLIP